MKLSASVLVAIPTVVLPTANATPQAAFSGEELTSDWSPATVDPGSFQHSVAGQFTPDQRADLVVLEGDRLVFVYGPNGHESQSEITTGVLDVSPVVGGGLDGLDSLVVTTADGVEHWWYDDDLGLWDDKLLRGQEWEDAPHVVATDMTPAGTSFDILGVSDAGDEVYRLSASTMDAFEWSHSQLFTTSSTIRQLVPIEWDGDSSLEIAVLTDTRVEVREINGTLNYSRSCAIPGGALARLQRAQESEDRLAWLGNLNTAGLQSLVIFSNDSGVESSLGMGLLGSVGMTAVDYDLDGDSDLVLSIRSAHDLRVQFDTTLGSLSGAPSFANTTAGLLLVPVGPTATQASSNDLRSIGVADFDGDGDIDLAAPVESSQKIEFRFDDTVDESTFQMTPDSATFDIDSQTNEGVLELDYPSPSIPTGATELQVTVWKQDDVNSDFEDSAVQDTFCVPVDSNGMLIEVPLPVSSSSFTEIYNVQLTFIITDSGGAILRSFPDTIYSIAMDSSTITDLLNEPDVTTTFDVVDNTDGLGIGTRRRRTKEFGPSSTPKPKLPTSGN